MKTVVLIPYREQGGRRRDLLDHVEARWREAGFDVFVGFESDVTGPFNRSAAINDAARRAGDWDVALIVDADTIVPPHQAAEAVELAAEHGVMVLAFAQFVPLSEAMSDKILDGFNGFWGPPKGLDWTCSSAIAVSRTLWDDVGGFDDGFVGWGFEDVCFALACDAIGGPRMRVDGPVWHLWHQPAPENDERHPLLLANKARAQAYIDARDQAAGDPDLARSLMLDVLRNLDVIGGRKTIPDPSPGVAEDLSDTSPAPDDATPDVDPPDTRTVAWIESADRAALLAEIARLDLEVNPQAKIGTLRKVLIANLPTQ